MLTTSIQSFGSECFFFFNYNRVNAAITNEKVRDHIESIFKSDIYKIRNTLKKTTSPWEREKAIITFLQKDYEEKNLFVLFLRILFPKKNAPSHYLVFITKNILGYRLMKELIKSYSTSSTGSLFEFDPHSSSKGLNLFQNSNSMAEILGNELLKRFSGKKISVIELINQHTYRTPYVLNDYQEALKYLYFTEGKINCVTENNKAPRKNSMNPKNTVIFP